MSAVANVDKYSCCSRVADVICNRQAKFVERLREARPIIEQCHVTMLCFKSDLERRKVTLDDKLLALEHIRHCCDALTTILGKRVVATNSEILYRIKRIQHKFNTCCLKIATNFEVRHNERES